MFDLGIIDASALVYTGALGAPYNERLYYGYPVGGIHYFLKYLSLTLKNYDDAIIVFDSRDNFRKSLWKEYKETRIPNKSVISQLKLLYEGLLECGFHCYRIDGYEGDDVINWAVSQNIDKYNSLRIYGNDRDLIHNVQNKVSFCPVRTGMNFVDISNFSTAIYKDTTIMFNTLNAYKVFCGCPSDNVKPFISEDGTKGMHFYNIYLQLFKQGLVVNSYENTSSKVLLTNFINQYNGFSEVDKEELCIRVQVIYPADCPDGITIVGSSLDTIDTDAFRHFLSLYNAFDALRCLELRKVSLNQEDTDFLKNEAFALSSGAFCVDNSIPVNTDTLAGRDLFLKEF